MPHLLSLRGLVLAAAWVFLQPLHPRILARPAICELGCMRMCQPRERWLPCLLPQDPLLHFASEDITREATIHGRMKRNRRLFSLFASSTTVQSLPRGRVLHSEGYLHCHCHLVPHSRSAADLLVDPALCCALDLLEVFFSLEGVA